MKKSLKKKLALNRETVLYLGTIPVSGGLSPNACGMTADCTNTCAGVCTGYPRCHVPTDL